MPLQDQLNLYQEVEGGSRHRIDHRPAMRVFYEHCSVSMHTILYCDGVLARETSTNIIPLSTSNIPVRSAPLRVLGRENKRRLGRLMQHSEDYDGIIQFGLRLYNNSVGSYLGSIGTLSGLLQVALHSGLATTLDVEACAEDQIYVVVPSPQESLVDLLLSDTRIRSECVEMMRRHQTGYLKVLHTLAATLKDGDTRRSAANRYLSETIVPWLLPQETLNALLEHNIIDIDGA